MAVPLTAPLAPLACPSVGQHSGSGSKPSIIIIIVIGVVVTADDDDEPYHKHGTPRLWQVARGQYKSERVFNLEATTQIDTN